MSFGSIQNNIALKPSLIAVNVFARFGSIQNNIALKPVDEDLEYRICFGSIQNNIALKPRRKFFLRDLSPNYSSIAKLSS